MYRYESDLIDYQVTRDHMLYVKTDDSTEYQLMDAISVYDKSGNNKIYYKKDCLYEGNQNYNDDLIEIMKYYDVTLIISLMSIYLMDGYYD